MEKIGGASSSNLPALQTHWCDDMQIIKFVVIDRFAQSKPCLLTSALKLTH